MSRIVAFLALVAVAYAVTALGRAIADETTTGVVAFAVLTGLWVGAYIVEVALEATNRAAGATATPVATPFGVKLSKAVAAVITLLIGVGYASEKADFANDGARLALSAGIAFMVMAGIAIARHDFNGRTGLAIRGACRRVWTWIQ